MRCRNDRGYSLWKSKDAKAIPQESLASDASWRLPSCASVPDPNPQPLYPNPYTLNPKPYTLYPVPYTLYPIPCPFHRALRYGERLSSHRRTKGRNRRMKRSL